MQAMAIYVNSLILWSILFCDEIEKESPVTFWQYTMCLKFLQAQKKKRPPKWSLY